MPLIETSGGTRMRVAIPPDAQWPELRAKAEEYDKLLEDRRTTGLQVDFLEEDLPAAHKRDATTAAKAIREGKEPPKPKFGPNKEAELAKAKARLAGLEPALDTVEQELVELVKQRGAKWEADLDGGIAEARQAFSEAISLMARARAEISTRLAVKHWLQEFPSVKFRGSAESPVRLLLAPNGDPYQWVEVRKALEADAESAEAQYTAGQYQPLRRSSPAGLSEWGGPVVHDGALVIHDTEEGS